MVRVTNERPYSLVSITAMKHVIHLAIFSELRYKYNITNLPNIVVVRLNGDIVTTNGRVELEAIGMNVLVTWDI